MIVQFFFALNLFHVKIQTFKGFSPGCPPLNESPPPDRAWVRHCFRGAASATVGVSLIPGATNVTAQNCGGNCEGGTFSSEQYAKVNGGGSNGISYLQDGVDFNDTYINTNLPFPNPDAGQEFNVDTNNMSVAYGNATGGIANVVTKSGTDHIHRGLTDRSFGQITYAQSPRILQFSFKVLF